MNMFLVIYLSFYLSDKYSEWRLDQNVAKISHAEWQNHYFKKEISNCSRRIFVLITKGDSD